MCILKIFRISSKLWPWQISYRCLLSHRTASGNCLPFRNHSTAENESVSDAYDKPNSNDQNENTQYADDEFTREFLNNRIQVTNFQRLILSAGSSLAALVNPHR